MIQTCIRYFEWQQGSKTVFCHLPSPKGGAEWRPNGSKALPENELWIHWSFRGTLGSDKLLPIGSMYGIYTNIGGILMVIVTIYSIHGSYGLWFWFFKTFQVLENSVLFATRKITLWLVDCLCNYTQYASLRYFNSKLYVWLSVCVCVCNLL